MANFDKDLQYASELARVLIIDKKVDPNHIDKDGKAPLHVAIKKTQTEALLFAKNLGLFDFNVAGRGGRTPL